MVNNETLHKKVVPPQKAEIWRSSDSYLKKVRAVKLVEGPEHQEKGSEYVSYALKVKSIDEAKRAYMKV